MNTDSFTYFDHAASTPLHPQVLALLSRSFHEDYANPSAKHILAKSLAKKIDEARERILNSVNADTNKYDTIFTSSATESNNQVIKTFLSEFADKEILHYLSDHPSVSNCMKSGVKSLQVSESLTANISQNTSLIILSHVNSQTGVLSQVDEIAKNIKESHPRVKVMVDSAQGLGKVPLTLKNSAIDYLIFAGHKIGAPRGIAGLIYKKDAPLKPLLNGGPHELNQRASTPPTSLILGLAKAVEISTTDLERRLVIKSQYSDKLMSSLESIHPNITFPWKGEKRSPYINTMIFKGIPSDIIMRHLEEKNILVSSSTACSSKVKVQNKMMDGLEIPKDMQKSVLRISMGYQTTEEEIDKLISTFKDVVDSISFLIK